MNLNPPAPSASPKRILLVEDDYANRTLFAEYLRYCGYHVLALTDGLNLFVHLKDFEPHLLLLDLGLPEISGFSLIQQIRASSTWSTLPVVVVSGYCFNADDQRVRALGAQAYLVKPIRLHDLSQTVATYASDSASDA